MYAQVSIKDRLPLIMDSESESMIVLKDLILPLYILSGSVYCDSSLRVSGFNGEGVSSSAALAVKTHESPKTFDVSSYTLHDSHALQCLL